MANILKGAQYGLQVFNVPAVSPYSIPASTLNVIHNCINTQTIQLPTASSLGANYGTIY